ncbi:glyoxalase [Pseudonocardia sp. CNS-139]|nr:glyoxalase [Pseudonocardia sp. CNS-139]
MAIPVQVTVDAHDPRTLASFWAVALGYVLEPPLPGYLIRSGNAAEAREQYTAIVDPTGVGPRVLFQRVPESKSVKNRVHLDVNASAGAVDPRAAVRRLAERLVAAGASLLHERDEAAGWWLVMADPEGNEFCIQ